MNKLTEKARAINFGVLASKPAAQSAAKTPAVEVLGEDGAARQPKSAIGAFGASLAMGVAVERENDELRRRVAEYEDRAFIELIDPTLIGDSAYANRDIRSFAGDDFARLQSDIAAAGRNVQPIKVRPVVGSDPKRYEIVFGHRRHRACLNLGLPVACVVEELDDVRLFAEMDRENRERADLTPWEQGVMYRRALDAGLFPSLSRLASTIGVDRSLVSKAVTMASLPPVVIAAFSSPLDLQYRWAQLLSAALQKDPVGVEERAKKLAAMNPRPSAKAVVDALCGVTAEATAPKKESVITVGKKRVAALHTDSRGASFVRFEPGVLMADQQDKLVAFIRTLLSKG